MSTYTMSAEIIFPETRGRASLSLRRVAEIHTEKSWRDFTGKAEIIFPRNVRDFNKVEDNNLFAIGDPITIKFGYGAGDIPVEFVGYLSDIADGIPYRLKCEDEMFKLKRGAVTVSKSNITLKELLQTIAPGYTVVCPDVPLGTVRYTNVAPVQVLENLKKELGFCTYFVNTVLHCFDGHSQDGETVNVILEKNAVSENLNRKTKADELVLVKFKSLQKNGKYLTVEIGDKNGTVQSRNWPYLTRADIEVRAKKIIEQHKTQGFDGSITLFGVPRVEQGMKIKLSSLFYKNLEGLYYIDKVVKDFTVGGIRQQITIGNKVL